MTKYLTTFNELKCHIDKKVKINWYNFETKRFENEIGFLEKYKFERHYFIKCNDFKFAGIIPSCVNSIELIEEDNQHIVDESTAGCCFAVNEGEMIQPADNINHPSHYQLEINNKLVDVNTILEAISKKLDGKCDLMTWNYFSNACEYLLRSFFKGQQLSDLQKAKKEIEFIINKLEK